MKKVLWPLLIAIVLLGSIAAGYRIINQQKTGSVLESFSSCGCGECGGTKPKIESLPNTSAGKAEFQRLKKELAEPPPAEACAMMGCSICVEYRLTRA